MIGDTIATDIAGGLAAGLLTALVETGNPVEELSNVHPAFRVKNLDELRQLMISAKIKA
jgi:ribonucleotide monophosphatase NagD (HAD superfamily)